MRGKRKLALIGTAIVLGLAVLGVGIGTAVVAASNNGSHQSSTTAIVAAADTTDTQTTTDNQTTAYDIFINKLADKLGLDEETVATAISEVRQEMRDEALANRLQEAVNQGKITQDEADQILAWMESRPAALDNLGDFGLGFGPGCEGGGRMMGPHDRGLL